MKAPMNRRNFLRATAGLGAAAALGPTAHWFNILSRAHGAGEDAARLIVLQFGGGTRNRDTIDASGRGNIPRLWGEMIPHGTLFTNMRVEHKVVHPNSTGSMMTGHWEWDDIDWSRPVAHPTIFEIFRRARRAPDTAAWVFAYASILAKTGESTAGGYGLQFAANVIEPPTIPRSTSLRMDRIMQRAATTGSAEAGIGAIAECAALARSTSRIAQGGLRSPAAREFLAGEYRAWQAGSGTTSHDAFLADRAIACMRTFAPAVMAVDFGEIDCAHYGSWSRYVEAIRRTDELTWKIWRATQTLQPYAGRTLLLILPDHGRELEESGGAGFVHHSDFYTDSGADEGCRRVWMLALGPGVAAGRRVHRPVPITTAAATGLQHLGLEPPRGAQESVLSLAA